MNTVRGLWVGLVMITVSGCGTKAPAGPPPREAVPVRVTTSRSADVPVTISAIGTVEARSIVSVKSMVSGELVRTCVDEGQDVTQGQILFQVDSRAYEAAVRQAEAALARDTALLDNARAEERRYSELAQKEYVTQEQFEKLRTSAETYAALVQSDQAALDNARVQLSYCTIKAPVTGRLGEILIHQGNVVKANDLPLVTIHQIRPVNIAFRIPENRLPEVRRLHSGGGLDVEAVPRGKGNEPVRAKLDFIDNAVDGATGTILLKATYPNHDATLWPGQFVDVRLVLRTLQQATTVSSSAVQTGQQGSFIFVVRPDATVELRPVVAGPGHAQDMVIEKGLSPGETVVTEGQIRLVPGSQVTIKDARSEGR